MAKMRTFTFYDGEETKTVEALGYRRAVKSFQNDTKSKQVRVEWQAKKRWPLRKATNTTIRQIKETRKITWH